MGNSGLSSFSTRALRTVGFPHSFFGDFSLNPEPARIIPSSRPVQSFRFRAGFRL